MASVSDTNLQLSCRVQQLRLLTKLEQAGLLTLLEKNGITLTFIEKSGLLSKAESLGLLSAAADRFAAQHTRQNLSYTAVDLCITLLVQEHSKAAVSPGTCPLCSRATSGLCSPRQQHPTHSCASYCGARLPCRRHCSFWRCQFIEHAAD